MANILIFYCCAACGIWEHLQSSSDAVQLSRACPKCRKMSEIADDAED